MGRKKKRRFSSDKELLDFLKNTIVDQIDEGKISLKVGDLLRILEIQKKLSSDNDSEAKFWEIIEKIRQEELGSE
ncbi:MAG: hypothetical protein ABIE07_01195 [Candidatus Zixiibacteriota bacterium]